jgi:hypothetical protein
MFKLAFKVNDPRYFDETNSKNLHVCFDKR